MERKLIAKIAGYFTQQKQLDLHAFDRQLAKLEEFLKKSDK